MTKLTAQQNLFLMKHSIPLSKVFDATGMRTKDWKNEMRELGKLVASGVKPCARVSHTLRTRSGHRVQCDTAKLAFLTRYDDPGEDYVAVSGQTGLVKIGSAGNINERQNSLNYFGYGGADDRAVE